MLGAAVSHLSPSAWNPLPRVRAEARTLLRFALGLAEPSERRQLRDALLLTAPVVFILAAVFSGAELLFAQTNPWEKAVVTVCKAFTGIIGRGLALVAVVIGGLMYAFGEGGSKSAIAGLIFGAGMVLGAVQFIAWIGLSGSTAMMGCNP